MVRAPACHAGGRGFKSRRSRHAATWRGAAVLVLRREARRVAVIRAIV